MYHKIQLLGPERYEGQATSKRWPVECEKEKTPLLASLYTAFQNENWVVGRVLLHGPRVLLAQQNMLSEMAEVRASVVNRPAISSTSCCKILF